MALILKNGKFFQDGNPVPLEFGNKEQIEIIKKANQIMVEGRVLNPSYTIEVEANVYFKCICGQSLFIEKPVDEEGDILCFDGVEKTCFKCQQKYVLSVKDKEVIVKGVKND